MVYVDSMGHMIADSEEELHRFAGEIGLQRAWYQERKVLSHYDLTTERMKLKAMLHGAQPVSPRFTVKKLHALALGKERPDEQNGNYHKAPERDASVRGTM